MTSANTLSSQRPVRVAGPQPMQGTIAPDAPPEAPEPKQMPLMKIVMPVVMLVAVVGMVAMMFVSGMARNPMTFMFPMMMVVSMLGMFAGGGSGSTDIGSARRDYQRHLASIRRAVVRAAADQRRAANHVHPDPADLWQMPELGRAFERSPSDSDYLTLRIGIGTQRPATPVEPPEIPAPEKLDPVSAVALRNVIRQARIVHQLPVAIDLKSFPVLAITSGNADSSDTAGAAIGLTRALIAQCAAFHHPEDVAIVMVGDSTEFTWLKWLPHNWDIGRKDGSGAWRLSGRSMSEALATVAAMRQQPRSVVLVVDPTVQLDDADMSALSEFVAVAESRRAAHSAALTNQAGEKPLQQRPRVENENTTAGAGAGGATGVCEVVVIAPNIAHDHVLYHAAVSVGLSFTVRAGRIVVDTSGGIEDIAAADFLGAASAEVVARQLSRVGRGELVAAAKIANKNSVLQELQLVPAQTRREFSLRWGRDRLRIPVGEKEDGSPIYLDFKESAEGGFGPHGLCVGATGSGKSEFLKSTVLGLAATHSPEQLNFVLVDFKGGATFLGLDALPHVSAVITNLADELVLVDRMQDAIRGEMTRRQEVLRAAGNFPGVAEYERARREGRDDLAPLPALLIVVDEFSELLAARPEFSELFVAVGRLGRSLHMHLLLASQRLEEGRLRGLESHLSYRIGLKTFSPAESRSVLGVPDAYHLPSIPGSGYLKTDSAEPVRFRAAYVSGPIAQAQGAKEVTPHRPEHAPVTVFSSHSVEPKPAAQETDHVLAQPMRTGAAGARGAHQDNSASILQATVDSMAHLPRSAHRVWLPPLPARISRTDIARLAATSAGSRRADRYSEPLMAVVGIVDKPLLQRQEAMTVDLRATGGHVAIVGAPRSGKTTAMRTLVLALAENSPASQLHFHLIDFGAGGLTDLVHLPHVSAVAHRGDLERIRRVVGFLRAEVSRREELFRTRGWHSIDAARAAGVAEIILGIDGWPGFRNEHATLADGVQTLVADGLAVGIHVMLTAHRWTELRPAVRDLMGTRVELRQAEAIDSMIDRKAAALVPDAPGRGIIAGGHGFLLADSTPEDTAAATAAFRRRGDDATACAPRLELLPRSITFAALMSAVGGGAQVQEGAHVQESAHVRDSGAADGAASSGEVTAASSAKRDARRRLRTVAVGLEEAGLAPVYFDCEKERHLLVFGAAGSGRTSVLKTAIASMARVLNNTKFVVIDYRRGMLEAVPEHLLAGYAGSAAVAVPLVQELAATLAKRLPPADITPAQLKARNWWTGPELVVVVDDYELVTGGRLNPLLPLAELIPHAADIGLQVVFARRISGAHRSLHDQVLGAVKDQGATALVMSGAKEDGPLFGAAVTAQPPGRGVWVAHGKPAQIVQIALPPEAAEPPAHQTNRESEDSQ